MVRNSKKYKKVTTEKINRYQKNKGKKFYGRVGSNDRPRSAKDCRSGSSPLCLEKGHAYEFLRFDNYGHCPRCGDEVLT